MAEGRQWGACPLKALRCPRPSAVLANRLRCRVAIRASMRSPTLIARVPLETLISGDTLQTFVSSTMFENVVHRLDKL